MRLTIGERSILRHTSVCSRRSENDQKGPPGPRDLIIEFLPAQPDELPHRLTPSGEKMLNKQQQEWLVRQQQL